MAQPLIVPTAPKLESQKDSEEVRKSLLDLASKINEAILGTGREISDEALTADQKAALAGTSGTPSATNPYVTKSGMMTDWADYPAGDYVFPAGTKTFAAGKVPIGAVTTNPTKGVTSEDKAQWRKDGPDCLIVGNYKQSAASAAGGNGIYLWSMPLGKTIDLTKYPVGSVCGNIVESNANDEISASTSIGLVYVYSSTLFYARHWYYPANNSGLVTETHTAYNTTNQYLSFRFTARVACAQFTPWGYV